MHLTVPSPLVVSEYLTTNQEPKLAGIGDPGMEHPVNKGDLSTRETGENWRENVHPGELNRDTVNWFVETGETLSREDPAECAG